MYYNQYSPNAARNRAIANNRAKAIAARRADNLKAWVTDERITLLAEARLLCGNSEFVQKMLDAFQNWGNLSEGQERALVNCVAKAKERQAQRKKEQEVLAASSKHVGMVGNRRVFHLQIMRVLSFDGRYGTSYIHIMNDQPGIAGGNVIVYKGSKQLGPVGDVITVTATVKEHGERDGVKQTIIARPHIEAT